MDYLNIQRCSVESQPKCLENHINLLNDKTDCLVIQLDRVTTQIDILEDNTGRPNNRTASVDRKADCDMLTDDKKK